MMMLKKSLPGISFLLLVMLVMSACSRQKEGVTSTQKMPITTQSKQALTFYQQGKRYNDSVQNSKAAMHYRKAVEQDPGFALAWLRLALVSGSTETLLAALDSAKHYASRASSAEQTIIRTVDLGIKGDVEAQARELDALIAAYPGDEEAHILKGNMLFGLQDYQQAIQSYSTAISIEPKIAIAYNQLGYCERALGNYGKAEMAFKQYIALDSENPNAFDSYAELLLEMGRYPESIEYYQQALALDSLFASSHIGIACDYGFMEKYAAARAQLNHLQAITKSSRDLRRAIYSEALTYVCEGDYETAINIVDKNLQTSEAMEDIPNMANDLIAMGIIYLEAGKVENALTSFDKSIQLINRSGLQAAIVANAQDLHLYNLASVYVAQDEMVRARETADVFEKEVAVNKNPIQIRLAHQLNGIIALADKNFQLAIDELQQADQMNPYNLYRMGQAYEGLGNAALANDMKLRAAELNVLNSLDQAIVLNKTRHTVRG